MSGFCSSHTDFSCGKINYSTVSRTEISFISPLLSQARSKGIFETKYFIWTIISDLGKDICSTNLLLKENGCKTACKAQIYAAIHTFISNVNSHCIQWGKNTNIIP